MKPIRLTALGLLAATAAAVAQEAPQGDPPQEPAETPATAEESPAPSEDSGLGSLDDLLGIEDAEADDETPADEDLAADLPTGVTDTEIERALTQQEARDALVSAAQQMTEAGFRIGEVRDTGVVTQRLQREIITKLDVLIEFAEQQQSQSSSSSSSSQQQQQSQSQQNQQQQGQRQAQQQASASEASSGEREDGITEMDFAEGQRDGIDATTAGWGALPERVRERLVDGSSDYFSTLYEALTEAYYRRLAEEASQ